MATVLRPLTTGELLDRTFFLYRKHFALFVGITALPYLVWLILQILAYSGQPGGRFVFARVVALVLSAFIPMLAMAVANAATVIAVSQVHLGRTTSVSQAYGAVKPRLVRLIMIMVGLGVGIGIGFILLIIPGIILMLKWALTVPVAVIEKKGLSDSTARSSFLTKGRRGRIFVVFFLFTVLTYIVILLWEVPMLAIIGISARSGHGAVAGLGWIPILAAVGSFVTFSIVGPLLPIALSLIYYDERVRREAFDLEVMMADLEGVKPGAEAVGNSV
jgi:hypothetical protein